MANRRRAGGLLTLTTHTLIEGDNLDASALLAKRGEQFDVIYLDPPYDTGAQLTYADSRGEDWVAFFQERVIAAKSLLADPHGVLIVAIDDRRIAQARIVTDAVLGPGAFVACVVWDGGVKGQARLVSTSHDYMLIYVADPVWYERERITWREPKAGVDEVLAAASRCWDGDPDTSSAKMKAWYRSLSSTHPANTRAMGEYNKFDANGRLFREGPVSRPTREGYDYDVIHPGTGKPVARPPRGWRYSPQRMEELLAQDRISFREDHTRTIATKLYLDEMTNQVATSVFTQKRTWAAKKLAEQIGQGKFTFPKDTRVLARWFRLVTQNNPEARFLDLFAGSGATAEAVMELNHADGGRRAATLVNINEVPGQIASKLHAMGVEEGSDEWEARGVFQDVLIPRVTAAANYYGERVEVLTNGTQEDRLAA